MNREICNANGKLLLILSNGTTNQASEVDHQHVARAVHDFRQQGSSAGDQNCLETSLSIYWACQRSVRVELQGAKIHTPGTDGHHRRTCIITLISQVFRVLFEILTWAAGSSGLMVLDLVTSWLHLDEDEMNWAREGIWEIKCCVLNLMCALGMHLVQKIPQTQRH